MSNSSLVGGGRRKTSPHAKVWTCAEPVRIARRIVYSNALSFSLSIRYTHYCRRLWSVPAKASYDDAWTSGARNHGGNIPIRHAMPSLSVMMLKLQCRIPIFLFSTAGTNCNFTHLAFVMLCQSWTAEMLTSKKTTTSTT